MIKTKQQLRQARAKRTHAKALIAGKPRLIVFRSNKAIYAMVMNDETGKIVCGANSLKLDKTGVEAAIEVGKQIAELAQKANVSEVAFDRNGYRFHGQIKSLADAAREAGLKF